LVSLPATDRFFAALQPDRTAALLLAALTVLMFVVFFALPADDAYIVARYVRQLYDGNGLVFNPGERINAITSPLLTFVLAAIHPLSQEPVDIYRVAAALLTAWTLVAIARRAYPTKVDGLLFLAMTLASPFVCFWVIGGLETPILLCACSWLTWFALSATRGNGPAQAFRIIGLATIAVLTRYDSVLYVAPLVILCLSRYRSDARVIGATIVCSLAVAAWVAFTYAYYGDVLPTSFYVKLTGAEGSGEVVRGVGYVLSFGVLTLVIPAAILRLGKREEWSEDRRVFRRVLALGMAAETVYAVFAGDKHMMYAYRLFVPYLPSLMLLLSDAGGNREAVSPRQGTRAVWVILCLGYQTLLGVCLYYFSENPNLSLVFRRQNVVDQTYEFSTIGAKYTKPFLAAVRASAKEIDAHWKTVSSTKARPMRVAALTGGTLPYYLPEAYTLETLVSYRHHCSGNLASFADYTQVLQNADAPSSMAQLFGSADAPWHLISKHEITVNGLQNQPFRLRVDIWFQEHPARLIFPSKVDEPCTEAKHALD
jgi:arabinofuranosyltransferase